VNRFTVLRIFTIGVLMQMLTGPGLSARQASEYQVKAAYLYNFAKFAEWPGSLTNRSAPLAICVLGKDPFGPALDIAVTEDIRGRKVVARRISKFQEGQDCSVLFIPMSEERRLGEILKGLERIPVLTVSDIPEFSRRGGMIQFVFEGNKIRFEVNLASSQSAGIMLSSELLKLASTVRRS
jgi:hypothetical protein